MLPSLLSVSGRRPVAMAGSRSLPPSGGVVVAAVSHSLLTAGVSLSVGCASGADAAVINVGMNFHNHVHCLSAFGPGGVGSAGSVSAVSVVTAFAAAGGSVTWWAGGGPTIPIRARLAARTRALVLASSGLVVFFASPTSVGSTLAARIAASHGLPIVAFALGFPNSALPSLGYGAWSPLPDACECWSGACMWVSEQAPLF